MLECYTTSPTLFCVLFVSKSGKNWGDALLSCLICSGPNRNTHICAALPAGLHTSVPPDREPITLNTIRWIPSNEMSPQPHFISHLKAQRLSEELAVAQKKVKEYEDMFAALYQNACVHCKEGFQRIGVVGAGAVSGPILASRTAAEVHSTSANSDNGPPNKSFWGRILKISFLGPFTCRRGTTTTRRLSAPDPGSPQVAAEQIQNLAGPSDPNFSPEKAIQSQYYVKFPDVTFGKPTLQVKFEHVWIHKSLIYSIKFSPDGKYLAVGVSDIGFDFQKTYIYDVTIGRKICLLADRYPGHHLPSPNYLSFSPGDGRYLATGHSTGQTMIWQVEKKHVRNAFGAHHVGENNCVDFSPNGRFIVSGSFKRSGVRIWSMRDGSLTLLRDHDDEALGAVAVKFSPDGKYVVASDNRGMLRLWNARTAKLVRKWRAHEDTVRSVAFTPNGSGLVTASRDHTLKYWDLGPPEFGDLREVSKFGHTKQVRAVDISPDGQLVVSGSYDCTARIWDIVDATLQCTLMGHEQDVLSVDFSPTNNYLACASRDGKLSMWSCQSSGN